MEDEEYQITQEMLQQEFNYYRSEQILMAMLKSGLINRDEYEKINQLNQESFCPFLGELMP